MSHHWLQPDWDPGVTVAQLPLQPLMHRGIHALLLDVDRTLLPGHDVTLPAPVLTWATEARRHLNLHLFSNNPSRQRIGAVADQLQVEFTSGAAKPRRAALRRVLHQLQLKPEEMAIVGDRLFTDVLAGNRLGLFTVLVRPLRADGTPCRHDRVQRLERQVARWMGAGRR
ncbi:Hydrolase HAD subfamily IIIA [Synechococcus sp. WH 8101]|jgi:HAD superfamily phosphatase (TIGR01668 family)|uniref:YqeG family HAD IIIA-type phosphatase n=1 Tax=Synechococcus sp. WH 8101 TaxID=59932 RepID=UPI0010239B84|nr:YqeG family HAD IIIA-type phosphatase [Synechococcus sp. WH 8101]QBE69160.1 Hydrolase HAD subfamily IIIA [Synechococcus sp. WH 8101]QNI45393.1 haloacid dehalogenase (HAD) family phosphatase [Synechococcus sp. WH 8101]